MVLKTRGYLVVYRPFWDKKGIICRCINGESKSTLYSGAYASVDDAVTDVLRLSQAMSYKNALADLPLGGGKSVIIGDPNKDKNDKLLTSFARFVQGLGGQYYTAEDIGIGISDVEVLAKASDYVFGLSATGDPSPFTARGCFEGIRAAVKHKLGRDSLEGLKVAVQGVGNVGRYVCKNLHEAGAGLIVADVNAEAAGSAVENFGAKAVAPEEIYAQDVDIFSPCAMGGVLNDDTIPQLKATIVAGVANNQLAEARHGRLLHNRGKSRPERMIRSSLFWVEVQGFCLVC